MHTVQGDDLPGPVRQAWSPAEHKRLGCEPRGSLVVWGASPKDETLISLVCGGEGAGMSDEPGHTQMK